MKKSVSVLSALLLVFGMCFISSCKNIPRPWQSYVEYLDSLKSSIELLDSLQSSNPKLFDSLVNRARIQDSLYYASYSKPKKKTQSDHIGDIFRGTHELRRISGMKITNRYFVFRRGHSIARTSEEIFAYFSWQMNDGTYAISFLPIKKIRVEIVEDQESPTIRFNWKPSLYNGNLEYLMDCYVNYAVVTLKSEDWPEEIALTDIENVGDEE